MVPNLSPLALRGLGVALAYLLAWGISAILTWSLRRHLAVSRHPAASKLAGWAGWGSTGRILGMAFSLGVLYLALAQGYLDPGAIGLEPADWQAQASWLPVVVAASSAWAAVLWGAYWVQTPDLEDHSPRESYGTPLGLPAHVLNMEFQASILRGGLVPAMGTYWGPWVACMARTAVALANPAIRLDLRQPQARPFLLLDLAADVAAAGCFALAGNMWISLVVRGGLHLATNVVHRLVLVRQQRPRRNLVAARPRGDDDPEGTRTGAA